MTASDYLKVQAELLIVARQARAIARELPAFLRAIEAAEAVGGIIVDRDRVPVVSDLRYMRRVAAAVGELAAATRLPEEPSVRRAMGVAGEMSEAGLRHVLKGVA